MIKSMHPFSIVALWLLGCTAQAQDDRRLLEAIGQVESGMNRNARGDNGLARGAYQLHASAWSDANLLLEMEGHYSYSFGQWRDATAQDMTALAYLRVIRSRLASLGIPTPTPEVIALCWNRGVLGAHRLNFAPNDYAIRVANLYRLVR